MLDKPALSDSGNDRIRDGGNEPPVFDAFRAHVDDLRTEAGAWLDGKAVTSADEAAGLNTLLDLARKTAKDADAARADEKKPHLDAGKAVDAKWKPVVDAAARISECCKAALTPWNIAEKARLDAIAARQRAEAEAEDEARREALRAAAGGSIEAREQADQLEASAKAAAKIAKRAEKEASGAGRLRTTYRAEVTDFAAAARHYWQPYHDRFEALVLAIAQEEVNAGKRSIPGITVHEEKKAF